MKLNTNQIAKITKIAQISIKDCKNTDNVEIKHIIRNTYEAVVNVKSNRFYLDNFKANYINLETLTIKENTIVFEIVITNQFRKLYNI